MSEPARTDVPKKRAYLGSGSNQRDEAARAGPFLATPAKTAGSCHLTQILRRRRIVQ